MKKFINLIKLLLILQLCRTWRLGQLLKYWPKTTQHQAVASQENRDFQTHKNPISNFAASRLSDFARMKPQEFLGSKVEEVPHEFQEDIYKIIHVSGVNSL